MRSVCFAVQVLPHWIRALVHPIRMALLRWLARAQPDSCHTAYSNEAPFHSPRLSMKPKEPGHRRPDLIMGNFISLICTIKFLYFIINGNGGAIMDFSTRVKALREDAGLTQAQLAEGLGLTNRAIGAWESGRSKPRLDKLTRLAEILGTTPDYLMNGDGPDHIDPHATSVLVPMKAIGVTCMGQGNEQGADTTIEVPEGVVSRHPDLFIVHGIGSCMNRRFPENAALGIDPHMRPETGDAVLVRDEAHGSFVHVYMAGSGGTVLLSADSWQEGYEDVVVGPHDPPVEVLGTVVWWQAYEDVVR